MSVFQSCFHREKKWLDYKAMRSKPSQYWLYIKSSCFESQNAQIKAHTRKRDLKNAQHNRKRIRARDQTALSDQNILYSFV